LGWFWDENQLRQATLATLLILLAVFIIVTLIKFAVRRPRPQLPGEFVAFQYDVYSFPSGHSARLAALAVSISFFDLTTGLVLTIVALGVSVARIMVGVHYPGDILVGLAIGALVAWEGMTFLPYLSFFKNVS
jgi:undecaprenyl-diphosphatase